MISQTIKLLFFCLVLPSLLAAQGNVKRDYNGSLMPGTNMADYTTYGWLPFIDSIETDLDHALVDGYITTEIDKQMKNRGFVLDNENPELLIQYFIATEKSTGTQTKAKYGAPQTHVGVGFGWGRPSFSVGMSGPRVVGHETVQVNYAHGTLIVGMMDVSSETTVWRGTATSLREDHGELINPKMVIEEVVPALFKEFPKVKRKKKK